MITAFGFVVAAAVGALTRAEAGRRWNRHGSLPVGTMAVNVSGSFVLGLLSELTPPASTILCVAGLGAYTTFSSFAGDAVALAKQKRLPLAGLYVAASCLLSIGGAGAGVAMAAG
ncbi:MAG: CrcB family protein [Actinobacteria bacterium]|nr:CrcB family protein [Actinomycetota bacterium]MBW3649854.1 CrcB family protein [Actinomycetota bacterium]